MIKPQLFSYVDSQLTAPTFELSTPDVETSFLY